MNRRRVRARSSSFGLVFYPFVAGLLAMLIEAGLTAGKEAPRTGEGVRSGKDRTGLSITGVTIYELSADYTWGYKCGLKQPLGACKGGLSVHQLTRSNYRFQPTYPDRPRTIRGNPDCLIWVNESDESYGVCKHPTGDFLGNVINPGGMVSFADDGTLWYTFGGRAHDLPFDLYRSDGPYDVHSFTRELDDYVTSRGSSTPCLNVHDPKLMLFWREGGSTHSSTTVRFRRYDRNSGFGSYELQTDIGKGVQHDTLGVVGIEQLWTRRDPRFGYTFVSWQWFAVDDMRFGSCPFLYSDDQGDTWRSADGAPCPDLPIHYTEIDNILVPYDHLATGDTAGWFTEPLGVSPNGTFWMAGPCGHAGHHNQWWVSFWFFNGTEWESRSLTGGMMGRAAPYACGVTRDYVVCVYSELATKNTLNARISYTNGRTWSEPFVLDVLDPSLAICWVSFVQPADDYADNAARFFYAYYHWSEGLDGRRYCNNIRWVKFDVESDLLGDFDGNCVVDYTDFNIFSSAYGSSEGDANWNPDCDLDGSGTVDYTDYTLFAQAWGTTC